MVIYLLFALEIQFKNAFACNCVAFFPAWCGQMFKKRRSELLPVFPPRSPRSPFSPLSPRSPLWPERDKTIVLVFWYVLMCFNVTPCTALHCLQSPNTDKGDPKNLHPHWLFMARSAHPWSRLVFVFNTFIWVTGCCKRSTLLKKDLYSCI